MKIDYHNRSNGAYQLIGILIGVLLGSIDFG